MSSPTFKNQLIVSAMVFSLGYPASAIHSQSVKPRPSAVVAGDLAANQLRLASMADPVGVDQPKPRFSWELRALASDAHDLRQSGYEILVASSLDELAKSQGTLWDSGRVPSTQRLYIPYGGQPLASHHSYFWKVRVWDEAGNASDWSAPAKWTTAILHPEDWVAHWIAAEPDGAPQPQAREHQGYWTDNVQPLPVFRKKFGVTGAVKSAIVFVSGLGQYELHLNGSNVTDTFLNPGWTDYRKTVLYNTFDVTQQLHPGTTRLESCWATACITFPASVGVTPSSLDPLANQN